MFGGAPAEFIEALEAEPVEFEVEPDNWQAVCVFSRLQTQWRYSFAGIVGLDYTAVEALFRILEIEDKIELFAEIQTMEMAFLKVKA